MLRGYRGRNQTRANAGVGRGTEGHVLNCPQKMTDYIEQQEGRIIRQGNMYKEMDKPVKIFRYVTEGTFDSYSWQVIENKQKFIGQIMTSKSPVRSCEDVDEAALTYAEVKALCTGNPYIKEKMDLDIQVSKLKLLKANHTSQKYRLEDDISKNYPKRIAELKEKIKGYEVDIVQLKASKSELLDRTKAGEPVQDDSKDANDKEPFEIKIGNNTYTERKEAGTALIEMCRGMKQFNMSMDIGEYHGFKLSVTFDTFSKKFDLSIKGAITYHMDIGSDAVGNMMRLNNVLTNIEAKHKKAEEQLINVETQLETAKEEVTKPFKQEKELAEKLDRLNELNALLNMDETGTKKVEISTEKTEHNTKEVVTSIFDRIAEKNEKIASNNVTKHELSVVNKSEQQVI